MKKKITKTRTKKAAKRVVRTRKPEVSTGWGDDRSMVIMLAAGTIVLVVVGMYVANWI